MTKSTSENDFKVLIIEDNPGDFLLVEELLLEKFKSLITASAKTFGQAKQMLRERGNNFDMVLLDLSLPDLTGIALIEGITELCPSTPVIVLTGYTDLEFGLKSLSLGISDYILKDELTATGLYKSIIYSFERSKISNELKESEKKYSELFHLSPLPMWVIDKNSQQILDVNNAAIEQYGYTREEFLQMTMAGLTQYNDCRAATLKSPIAGIFGSGIYNHIKKNNNHIQVEVRSNHLQYAGKEALLILGIDITERLNHLKAIENQNIKLREISWIQSHVVRAPLAKIMGLIPLLTEKAETIDEKTKMLEYLLLAANELDLRIKEISDKTIPEIIPAEISGKNEKGIEE